LSTTFLSRIVFPSFIQAIQTALNFSESDILEKAWQRGSKFFGWRDSRTSWGKI